MSDKETTEVATKPETRSIEFTITEANDLLGAVELGLKNPVSPSAKLSMIFLQTKQKLDQAFKD